MDSIEKKDYPSFKEAKEILERDYIAKEAIYLAGYGWNTPSCYLIVPIKKNKSI